MSLHVRKVQFNICFFILFIYFLLIDTDNTYMSTIHTTVYTTENLYMDVTLDCHNLQGA